MTPPFRETAPRACVLGARLALVGTALTVGLAPRGFVRATGGLQYLDAGDMTGHGARHLLLVTLLLVLAAVAPAGMILPALLAGDPSLDFHGAGST